MRARLVAEAALAVAIAAAFLVLFVVNASYTFAFDYRAYELAAQRLLAGEPLYDLRFVTPGAFGLFFYPPPFVLLVLPFAVLPGQVGEWLWLSALTASGAIAVAILPVRPRVRIVTFALMATSWPFIFSVKVGQVGPILLLLFAIGWRSLHAPRVVGLVAALGAIIKIQPGLLLAWLVLVGRTRAAVLGLAVAVIVSAAVTLLVGPQAWLDLITLMQGLENPLTTPRNFSPGSVAVSLGAPLEVAALVQALTTAITLGLVVVTARRGYVERSYLIAIVATQLASPILWDHYAIVLALPLAWLLERRQWWAAAVPILQGPLVLNAVPPLVWLAGYAAIIIGVASLGARSSTARPPIPSLRPAARRLGR